MRASTTLIILMILLYCLSCTTKKDSKAIDNSDSIQEADSISHINSLVESDSLKTFYWESESCANRGLYNRDKYSEEQLKDTYYLCYNFNSINELIDVTLDYPKDLNSANIDRISKQLDADYTKANNRLRGLKIIPTRFWANIRNLKINELKELYDLEKLTIEAYKTPAILANKPYTNKCQEYVDALASEDSVILIQTWAKLVELKKRNNGAPEKLTAKFNDQMNSTDRLLYAKIDLMTFGWWNCANHQRKFNDLSSSEPIIEEFEKIFTTINSECDDVD